MKRILLSAATVAVVGALAALASADNINCNKNSIYVIPGVGGKVVINGTSRDDKINCGNKSVTVNATQGGNDRVTTGNKDDTITVDNRNNRVNAGGGNNKITAGNGS